VIVAALRNTNSTESPTMTFSTKQIPTRVLLASTLAAAFVAVATFDIASGARGSGDPRLARAFDRACDALPPLGALRLHGARPDAADRLVAHGSRIVRRVLRPPAADPGLARQRLLGRSDAELEEIRAALARRELPPRLPDAPDLARLFPDWPLEVILEEGVGTAAILSNLPEASASGEPLLREADARRRGPEERAIVLAVVAAAALAAWRERAARSGEKRLLAAFLPLAVLGILGLSADPASLLATALVAAAPLPALVASGGVGLFLGSPIVRRAALVLLVGGIVRGGLPARGARAGREELVALAGGVALVLLSLLAPIAAPPTPPEWSREYAVAFAARAPDLAPFAVAGDASLLAPVPSPERVRVLREVYRRAEELARGAPEELSARFLDVRNAAAGDAPELTPDLKARLVARDGRSATWILPGTDPRALARVEGVEGPAVWRARVGRGARRDGRVAAVLGFVAGAGALVLRRGRGASTAVLGVAAGALSGGLALHVLDAAGLAPLGESAYPLVVAAALSPGALACVPLALAGACAPATMGAAAAAMIVASLVSRYLPPMAESMATRLLPA